MRLGKEQARGVIDEPAEDLATTEDPVEDPRRAARRVVAHQQQSTFEDQPASTG